MSEGFAPKPVSHDWSAIFDPSTSLVVEPRDITALQPDIALVLASPKARHARGSLPEIALQIADLPKAMRADINAQCARFLDLLGGTRCRLRLEAIDRQPCWKWHADFVRVRLITSYSGAGTDYLLSSEAREEEAMRLPAGAIGLFKGREFAAGHAPCIHRSPRFAPGDPVRLVLVIDEDADAGDACHA